jgi:hypothetical protein
MTEIILRKVQLPDGRNALVPVDDEGAELIAKLKDGRDVGADVVQRRNPRQHRLAFALFHFVKMHCELFSDASIDEIKDAVKLATGFVRRYVDADTAQTFYVCKSISWAACDQTEFNQFFDAACSVIANRWMPGDSVPEEVRRELIEMVDGKHAIGERAA